MDLEGKSWLKAGLLGSGVDVAYSVLTSVLSIIPFLACISCLMLPLTCVLWVAIPIATGFMASKWAKLKSGDTEAAVKEGALAGLVLGLISGSVNFVIQIIFSIFNLTYATSLTTLSDNSDYADLSFLPFSVGSTLVCGLFALVIGIVFDMVFSLLGGIIYTATAKE